jgi:hypothetical protein
MGIYIIGKQGNIEHQTGHRNGGNLISVRAYKMHEIPDGEQGIKFDKIINNEAQQRGEETKEDAEFKVIFF